MALTDEQIELLSGRLVPLYQELEQEVIADIARRVKKTGMYTETAEIMAKSLMEKGYSPAKIRSEVMRMLRADKEYQKAVDQNTLEYKQEITEKIRAIEEKAKAEGNKIVAEAGTMAYNNDLSMWEQAGKNLSEPNGFAQLVEAMRKQTEVELKNLTKTTGFKGMGLTAVENAYTHQMDLGLVKLTSGGYSWQQVVNDCVRNLSQSGLRQIDFKSGRSMQLDTAARLCIRTASGQLAGKVTMLNMEATGEQLVEVSSHWGARTDGSGGHSDHAYWQGKVYAMDHGLHAAESRRIGYSIKNLEDVTGYPSDPAGLCGYNCRHTMSPFFEGISEPNKWDPEPNPVEYRGRTYTYYQATQKQRQMERDIRATKREIEARKAVGEETSDLRNLLKRQSQEYHYFSDTVGIRAKDERLRVQSGASNLKKTKDYKVVRKVSSFTPAKTIEEAQKTAEHLGVKYVAYDNLSLDMANELNSALETLPEDIRPVFVGDSTYLESYRGAKLPRTSNHFYGVHIDVPPGGLLLGRDSSGRMRYDFEVQGQMVGISKKYNSAEKIAKSKIAEQEKYVQKHGNKWFFNEDGRSTPYHEMGHVYADAKGIPYGFEKDAERWALESGCDVLKNKTEAWCEAWGAYHTNNPNLPDYIAKYIESATKKPIAKSLGSGIITSVARIIDPDSDAGTKFAKMYYKEIRSFSTDSKKIAKNLGKSEKEIKQIKEYLFETGFDPDCAIAQSWQRLVEGKDIKPHDRTLIEHELLEMQIKREHPEIEHWKAHEIATKKYDYQKEAGVYYGNLEKHKKNK